MKISTKQIELEDVTGINFDLILGSSGYESRGTFLFTSLEAIKGQQRVVLSFDNYQDEAIRIYNDKVFKNLGFDSSVLSGNDNSAILKLLDRSMAELVSPEVNILVDYSCMTRVWYAEILRFFYNSLRDNQTINLYFSYSVSEYVAPPENGRLNKFVSPIPGFYSLSTPTRPTALIIGLGYISTRAFGLSEYFDVSPYLFINDTNFNDKFHYEVLRQNEDVLKNVPSKNIFLYPLNNLSFTETLLNHLCHDLLTDYRIVLAPCGPKPFTLVSLITCLRLRDVDVWRISAGENEVPMDKKPSGSILILKTTFQH